MFKNVINPLMSGGNEKLTHTETNLQLKAVGLIKYMWPFYIPPGIKTLLLDIPFCIPPGIKTLLKR